MLVVVEVVVGFAACVVGGTKHAEIERFVVV